MAAATWAEQGDWFDDVVEINASDGLLMMATCKASILTAEPPKARHLVLLPGG
jgi:hypothetical protein